MNQHQILTGAVNAGDTCYSVGSVEGVPFTAYAAGCNVVILASDFQRVQIIPGILHGNVQVACLESSTDVGKIAAAYGKKVCIFEPTPLLGRNSVHKLDYKWIQTAALESDCHVSVISWNLEGSKVLTGGTCIQMWHLLSFPEDEVLFETGQEGEEATEINPEKPTDADTQAHENADKMRWDCVWKCRTASPVCFLRFSPDGGLFVSAGKADRLVKIWYESAAKTSYFGQSVTGPEQSQNWAKHPPSEVQINYSFIYVAHPRAITGISWRGTSKYTPRGCNANMLVTSCRDNICRLWVQTLLPDDGLINFSQIEGLANHTVPRAQTQHHRQKIMQRLRHMKSFNQFKKRQAAKAEEEVIPNEPIPNLPSTYSVHDFHSFSIHGTAMTPGLHFHLAASINAETDIPLVPSLVMAGSSNEAKTQRPNFVMHWLNNKEMVFTQAAERILHEVSLRIFQTESAAVLPQSEGDEVDGDSDMTGECEYSGEVDDMDADSTLTAESGKKLRHKLCHGGVKTCKKHGGSKAGQGQGQAQSDSEKDSGDPQASRQSINTVSSSASIHTEVSHPVNLVNGVAPHAPLGDVLDRKFEALLREWHSSPDLLFSVHPIDGSLLVWLVEWLDETSPGSFRQAQVSFSSRIPNAIPLGDAATMSHNLALYSPHTYLDLRAAVASSASVTSKLNDKCTSETMTRHGPGHSSGLIPPLKTPTVCMISKHSNGSLNQWALSFGEDSNFTQVLSISHGHRVSGHRFRVNDISCHPVLPLLLTTSHHNLPGGELQAPKSGTSTMSGTPSETHSSSSCCAPQLKGVPNAGFCSELILWKVEPVGPLSKSGGVSELARINSPDISAFANVAWIPTLLPSATLGSISNSPSACFIASDGHQLRVYQAIIDARTLLAEVSAAERYNRSDNLTVSGSSSSELGMLKHHLPETFKIVSLQSTSRPGCILELDGIADAIHDWQNTQLLHVFQDQLIRGDKVAYKSWNEKLEKDSPGLVESSLGAVVDLRHSAVFQEPFYLIVLDKSEKGQSLLHMWKLVISSHSASDMQSDRYAYVPDSNLIQDTSEHSNQSSRSGTPDLSSRRDPLKQASSGFVSPLKITTSKVCTQYLSLPEDVEIIHAAPAAGHLSSSNIYPACFAPYLLTTACSDGYVRFWRCKVGEGDSKPGTPEEKGEEEEPKVFKWVEWEMMLNNSSSAIEVPGLPLYVSCAYSGRIACAYKHGQSFSRPASKTPNARFININLAIFECESTGGSEWILEDTIKLKNVVIPQTELNIGIDLGPLINTTFKNRKTADTLMMRLTSDDAPDSRSHNLQRLLSVPSYTTMQSLKKIIAEQGNQFTLTQKSLVQLDWVSTEDGSHVLTVSVGSKVSVFTPVSTDIAQANLQAMKASSKTGTAPASRMLLKQASSMAAPLSQPDDIRWMTLRTTYLKTADGLPPLPMQMSWVRDGILVVGMDNEMHIYTQWKNEVSAQEQAIELVAEATDSRVLTEHGLLSHAQESSHLRLPTASHSGLPRSPSSSVLSAAGSMISLGEKKQPPQQQSLPQQPQPPVEVNKDLGLSHLPDFGIFEASRLACPVLPQYHPKQLMELLAFGKIYRVRAILSHLVISLCSMDSLKEYFKQQQQPGYVKKSDSEKSPRSWMRSRTLSVAAPPGSPGAPSPLDLDNYFPTIPEEVQLDYTEITSIRPLPLFTLVEAEFENPSSSEKGGLKARDSAIGSEVEYDGLFDSNSKSQVDETLDEILERSAFSFNTKPKKSEKMSLTSFGPRQARLLTKLLTHSHLPGLSSLDQMHLLALADAVASFNPSVEPSTSGDSGAGESGSGGENVEGQIISADSLDDCGLRFLLTMRQHTYLLRCLPLGQRKQLQKVGLGTSNLVWAFHSETQEELAQLIPSVQRGNPKWAKLRELGIGWWIRNNNILRRLIEQVAKAAFQCNQDPLDAALFYLAMKKKSLVWGLYRSVQDKRMTDFFQHNFTEDKWRKAALTNAYALLGKQRFEHAAAFFLLAGSVWDAIEICLNKLEDLQLAMVITRLYEGDIETVPETLKRLLYQEVLGCNRDGTGYRASAAHPDPFLRSMSYWMLHDYNTALSTLLETDLGSSHKSAVPNDFDKTEAVHPSVFNFYLYLRTQPLIVRRQLAQSMIEKKESSLLGKGKIIHETSYFGDAITPFERRLFFITAHQHFRAGCPSLGLEVLSRLPNRIVLEESEESGERRGSYPLDITDSMANDIMAKAEDKSDSFDWGAPVKKEPEAEFDWGAPATSFNLDEQYKIDINVDPGSDDDADTGLEMKSDPKVAAAAPSAPENNREIKLDIMAQQLKFIACLKILMEELSTLATGFEVDGGQLRYHLYVWLEKSVLALKTICNYRTFSMRSACYGHIDNGPGSSMALDHDLSPDCLTPRGSHSGASGYGEFKPTLHEILLADKLDFEAKLERASRRKQWLRANEALLRTLLSYCSLHGAHGGGLASVRMELILLLQELQQERSQHQLLSPLPFPTTLPLLAASVACQKTVIADPIRHLQSITHDILSSVVDLQTPPLFLPSNYSDVYILRDLGISLSACIYQSLCDSDNVTFKGPKDRQDFLSNSVVCPNSHLLAGHKPVKQPSMTLLGDMPDPLVSTTPANKWPGVQSLRALLAKDKDEDSPKLHTLLCEAYVGVYLSQLLYALAACDAHMLYRLVGLDFSDADWSSLFGGGAKKLIHVAFAPKSPTPQPAPVQPQPVVEESSSLDLFNTLSKQRMKLHMKILQQLNQEKPITAPNIKEDRPTYREQFVPPVKSILSCLMSKPKLPDEFILLDYNSSESVESDDNFDENLDDFAAESVFGESTSVQVGADPPGAPKQADHDQYAWGILRCATVKLARYHILQFMSVAGIEMQDLPTTSPLIHAVFKVMEVWHLFMRSYMDDMDGPPSQFLPNSYIESTRQPGGPAIHKYKSLLETNNTPFRPHNAVTKPSKRLWNFLVRQEKVQDIFIRYVFGKPKSYICLRTDFPDAGPEDATSIESVRIVHKDQDNISAFCINRANPGLLALSTPKEVQELDMSVLLEPVPWLEEEAEYDILNLLRAPELLPQTDYLVVQHPSDRLQSSPGGLAMQASSQQPGSNLPPPSGSAQTGRGTIMLKRHRTEGTRRMSSHPTLPLYLSGSQDGSVTLWEWNHVQQLSTPRASGTFAKVTRVGFNQQGNKFGVTDGDGNLSLWQVALTSSGNKPFFSMQVHSKQACDFTFLGSSSLLITAGQSTDHKNVSMWDTLLPLKKALVTSFACHEQHGASAITYAPLNQLLITGGKKGDVNIFDMRQRTQRHKFQAHESAVKCLALDPGEEFFVTGSADGDIRVWSLVSTNYSCLYSFTGEHSRSTLFRNIGMGVSHLYVDAAGRLFSCGADGSMKLRQLPERGDGIVTTL